MNNFKVLTIQMKFLEGCCEFYKYSEIWLNLTFFESVLWISYFFALSRVLFIKFLIKQTAFSFEEQQ